MTAAIQHRTRLIAEVDAADWGGGMQLLMHKGFLYLGHLSPGGGTTIVDVHNPRRPCVAGHLSGYPGAYSPKVQIGDDLLLVNYEQRDAAASRVGLGIFDLSTPTQPREIGFFPTGGTGVHRMWYVGGRYAYLSARPNGFCGQILQILDLATPSTPELVGQWWIPGLWTAGGEEPVAPEGLMFQLHHPIIHGERAYLGCWDYGLVILDMSDPTDPHEISHLGWAPTEGGSTHTALPLPGRGLLAITDEAITDDGHEPPKYVRLVDMSNETHPQELSRCPTPPYNGMQRPGRFGPHNLHENRPGSFSSESLLFVSYFGAGLRVYDITHPRTPQEIAHFIPAPPPGQVNAQTNDLYVDVNGLVYLSDRKYGRIHIVEGEW